MRATLAGFVWAAATVRGSRAPLSTVAVTALLLLREIARLILGHRGPLSPQSSSRSFSGLWRERSPAHPVRTALRASTARSLLGPSRTPVVRSCTLVTSTNTCHVSPLSPSGSRLAPQAPALALPGKLTGTRRGPCRSCGRRSGARRPRRARRGARAGTRAAPACRPSSRR